MKKHTICALLIALAVTLAACVTQLPPEPTPEVPIVTPPTLPPVLTPEPEPEVPLHWHDEFDYLNGSNVEGLLRNVITFCIYNEDYDGIFDVLSSPEWQYCAWQHGGSLPGYVFEPIIAGFGNVYFDTETGKMTVFTIYSDRHYPQPDEEWNYEFDSPFFTAIYYYGTNFVFRGNYAKGVLQGDYSIYRQSADSPETYTITYTTCDGDVLIGEATVETYKNGELISSTTTDEYDGMPVPSDGSSYNYESPYWDDVPAPGRPEYLD